MPFFIDDESIPSINAIAALASAGVITPGEAKRLLGFENINALMDEEEAALAAKAGQQETIVQNVTLNKEGELEVPPGMGSVTVSNFTSETIGFVPMVGEPQPDAPTAGENTDTEAMAVEDPALVITEGE